MSVHNMPIGVQRRRFWTTETVNMVTSGDRNSPEIVCVSLWRKRESIFHTRFHLSWLSGKWEAEKGASRVSKHELQVWGEHLPPRLKIPVQWIGGGSPVSQSAEGWWWSWRSQRTRKCWTSKATSESWSRRGRWCRTCLRWPWASSATGWWNRAVLTGCSWTFGMPGGGHKVQGWTAPQQIPTEQAWQ